MRDPKEALRVRCRACEAEAGIRCRIMRHQPGRFPRWRREGKPPPFTQPHECRWDDLRKLEESEDTLGQA